MKLIVGLGNPGTEYEHTRHNIGFDVVDILAFRQGTAPWKNVMKSQVTSFTSSGEKILLVKPVTYMNASGEAVGEIAHYYKVASEDIFVVCDDLDLPPGNVRIRLQGAAGGHNGIRSLISHLGTEHFNRFRIGIGHPSGHRSVVDHVLSRPEGEEALLIKNAENRVADALESALENGMDKAMNQFNSRRTR
jgi:PTH1 family peptidyl-tRNA hydrolase